LNRLCREDAAEHSRSFTNADATYQPNDVHEFFSFDMNFLSGLLSYRAEKRAQIMTHSDILLRMEY
jgi:hypothetical protein